MKISAKIQEIEKGILELRAQSALHALTSLTDPELNYLPYWCVETETERPFAKHTRIDESELAGSWAGAVLLMRKMSGSKEGIAAEEGLKEILLSNFDKDGIRYHSRYPWSPLVYCNIHEMGYILEGLVTWYLDSRERRVSKAIETLIKGLDSIVFKRRRVVSPYEGAGTRIKGRYYDFPFENYYQGKGWDPLWITFRSDVEMMNRVMILPLLEYFEATGYEKAFSLAEGLIASLLSLHTKGVKLESAHGGKFDYQGRWTGHFVSGTWVVSGIMKYALITKNKELMMFIKNAYDWAVSQGSSYGWFPEHIGTLPPQREFCETCCITRVIEGGIILARAGYPEYWNALERFARNQLLQVQLMNTDAIANHPAFKKDTMRYSYKDIAERVEGIMLGYSLPNSLVSRTGNRAICGCCSAIGAKGLYLIWDNIVEKKGKDIYLHLLFSRETPFLDVESFLPSQGKLQITTFSSSTLFVRIPEFAGKRVSLKVNGAERKSEWSGSYVKIQGLKKGDGITVSFPLPGKETIETIGGRAYQISWQGDQVIRVSPNAKKYLIYI